MLRAGSNRLDPLIRWRVTQKKRPGTGPAPCRTDDYCASSPTNELFGVPIPVTSSQPGVVWRLSVWFIVRKITVVPLVSSSPLLKFTRTAATVDARSEEHTSELQSHSDLV